MAVIIPLIGGMLVSLQSSLNGSIGKRIGTIECTYLSFFMGTVLLTIIAFFFGDGNILHITKAPIWQWIVALFGFTFILVMVFTLPKIGVTATSATLVIGQLTTSMAIDHFGLFGTDVTLFTMKRFIGALWMAGALYFIYMEITTTKRSSKTNRNRPSA